ncbi:MAG: cytochrome c, class [Bryobacterales bacterium]|nr:cytochrome c, class [Bryobacterales bacterium]
MKMICVLMLASSSLAFQNTPETLPAPYATPSVSNGAKVVARPAGAEIKLPQGFTVEQYATGFQRPRFMVQDAAGDVLVSDAVPNGSVYVLHNGEKKALLSGLDRPYGLAFWKDYLYVAETTSLKRYKYDAKTMTAGAGEELVPMKGFDKGHITRTVLFSPKGDKMYLGIGSSANVVTGDPELRAAVTRFNPDGTGQEIVASGLRNPIGMRFHPSTGQLWATVQERDGLGDGLVADYFTSVRPGGFYGWPYAYLGQHEDPRITEKRKDLVDRTIRPDVLLEPHTAVLDFIFYTGKQFPAEYRGGAFLANHGSSNRAQRIGYSLSFVPFKNGKPSGPTRDFLTGFMLAPDSKEVWGRPVGLLQLSDGSMLLSEDGGKTIWRISYKRS